MTVSVERVEFHVEEPSAEAALHTLLPRVLGTVSFRIFAYQGKPDLLRQLPSRLRSQASWLPETHRIVIVVDVDDDDCAELRRQLDQIAREAGLRVREHGDPRWQIANRLAIEELEAWYFGDWAAVRAAFPRVPATIRNKASFRKSDEIKGGTWEAFERVLQEAGYYAGGLQKVAAARAIAAHMDLARNDSPSFGKLRQVISDLVGSAESAQPRRR